MIFPQVLAGLFPPPGIRRRGFIIRVLFFFAFFVILFQAGSLFAEDRRGKRVIRIQEATRIIGEVQRPQVTYILNRSQRVQMSLDPSLERIRPSFLGEFRGVVERNPHLFLPRSEP